MHQKGNIIFSPKGKPVLIFPDYAEAMCTYNTMQLEARGERSFFGRMRDVKPERKRIAIDKRGTAERFFGTHEVLNHEERRIRR